MLHVCYDKDFVNMQISFLGLKQKFSKNYLGKKKKKNSCSTFVNTAHLRKKLLKYLSKQYQLSFISLKRNEQGIQMFCTC